MLNAAEIVKTALEYITIPSVVGYEFPFVEYLKKQYEELGCSTSLVNNCLYVHGTHPLSNLLSVHIDRHGLIKTGANEYRYAGFVVEKDRFHVDYFKHPSFLHHIYDTYVDQPVVAYDYMCGDILAEGVITHSTMDEIANNLIFHVAGTEDVPIGTPLSYSLKSELTDTTFAAQLDNVISAAIVYQLYLHGYQGSVLFTPEEEIGQSWSYVLHHLQTRNITTQHMIVLDTCPFDTTAELDQGMVILRNKDALGTFNQGQVQEMESILHQQKIPYVKADEAIEQENQILQQHNQPLKGLGLTELGQLVSHTQARYNGITLQVPTVGYHSNQEMTSLQSIENIYITLASYLGLDI